MSQPKTPIPPSPETLGKPYPPEYVERQTAIARDIVERLILTFNDELAVHDGLDTISAASGVDLFITRVAAEWPQLIPLLTGRMMDWSMTQARLIAEANAPPSEEADRIVTRVSTRTQ